MPYRLVYSLQALEHLKGLSATDRTLALEGIKEQLTHQPGIRTRNRKPMRLNPVSEWELRIGDLRVYFDIEETSDPIVRIQAVGVKVRESVWIGGKVVDL